LINTSGGIDPNNWLMFMLPCNGYVVLCCQPWTSVPNDDHMREDSGVGIEQESLPSSRWEQPLFDSYNS